MPTQTQAANKFKKELLDKDLNYLVSRWVFERTPFIFSKNNDKYLKWKRCLAQEIQIDSRALCLVGSSATGFSLSPYKNFKLFTNDSDIDVAAVSSHHFEVAWNWMRALGAERHSLPLEARNSLKDHRQRLIYFGIVASDRILPNLPFGPSWVVALSNAAGRHPIEGREINVRIFRDFAALRAYQLDGIKKLRNLLLGRS